MIPDRPGMLENHWMNTLAPETLREAVGVFNDAESLESAIDALESAGFDRSELSLLASEHTIERELGHAYERVEQMEDDPDAPRIAYISTESIGDAEGALIGGPLYIGATAAAGAILASGGAIGAAIIAAAMAGGFGAAIGTVLAEFVGRHHAEFLTHQLEHGGLLLWVETRDATHEEKAQRILSEYSAHDVHIHEILA